jgi:hypothetical protein
MAWKHQLEENYMKRNVLIGMNILVLLGMVLLGCPTGGGGGDNPPGQDVPGADVVDKTTWESKMDYKDSSFGDVVFTMTLSFNKPNWTMKEDTTIGGGSGFPTNITTGTYTISGSKITMTDDETPPNTETATVSGSQLTLNIPKSEQGGEYNIPATMKFTKK